MTKDDIHNLAEQKNIKWDDDPVFKLICKGLTGKEHLDDMEASELETVYEELIINPNIFSRTDASIDNFVFKKNNDYDTGNFLDKVKKTLWKPYNS